MNNTDLLERFLADLRSGKHEQIDGVMCDGNGGYCVLGRLEMVATGEVETYEDGDYRALPTLEFWENTGISAKDILGTGIGAIELVMMNDTEGLCFAEIANRLEGK